jgi:hypothetical protein
MSQIVGRMSPLFADDWASRSLLAIRIVVLRSRFHRGRRTASISECLQSAFCHPRRNYAGLRVTENQLNACHQGGGDPRRAQLSRTGSQDFLYLIAALLATQRSLKVSLGKSCLSWIE